MDRQAVWVVGSGDVYFSVGVAGQHQYDATNDPESRSGNHTYLGDDSGVSGTSGGVKADSLAFAVREGFRGREPVCIFI